MNAHEQVSDLLGKLLALVPASRDPEAERLTDEISTLVMAYTLPTVNEEFDGVGLSRHELRVVELLHARIGRIVTRQAIMSAVYFDSHGDDEPGQKILDIFVMRSRQKLKSSHFVIETEHGIGYRMVRKPQ